MTRRPANNTRERKSIVNTRPLLIQSKSSESSWGHFRWIGYALVAALIVGYATPGARAKTRDITTPRGSAQPDKMLTCSGTKLTGWNVTVQELLENEATLGCQPDVDSAGNIGYRGSAGNVPDPWQINLKAKFKNGASTITHLAVVRPGGIIDIPFGSSINIVVGGALRNGICVNHFNDYLVSWTAPTSIVQGGVTYTRDSMEWKLDMSETDSRTIKTTNGISGCINVTQCNTVNVDTWVDVDSNCPGGVFEDDWFAQFVHTKQQG